MGFSFSFAILSAYQNMPLSYQLFTSGDDRNGVQDRATIAKTLQKRKEKKRKVIRIQSTKRRSSFSSAPKSKADEVLQTPLPETPSVPSLAAILYCLTQSAPCPALLVGVFEALTLPPELRLRITLRWQNLLILIHKIPSGCPVM